MQPRWGAVWAVHYIFSSVLVQRCLCACEWLLGRRRNKLHRNRASSSPGLTPRTCLAVHASPFPWPPCCIWSWLQSSVSDRLSKEWCHLSETIISCRPCNILQGDLGKCEDRILTWHILIYLLKSTTVMHLTSETGLFKQLLVNKFKHLS